jgi:branched-chain amino acid transport system substrate-binding protein
MKNVLLLAFVLSVVPVQFAQAQIKIGVTVSEVGPAASLGIVEKNVIALLPPKIAEQSVRYTLLNDNSDTTNAVQNAQKLANELGVDAIIGSTTTPNCLAITEVAAESGTPQLAMGAGAAIVEPMTPKKKWVFKPVHNDGMMVEAIVADMARRGVKKIGFFGFADATGEGYWAALQPLVAKYGLSVVANERYNRTDTSVSGQVLKLVAAGPDAILIAAFGTPAALPQIALRERNYRGKVYQTHGVANNDFLRVSGRSAEDIILPLGPLLVADQLPDSNPSKKVSLEVIGSYEGKYGAGSRTTFISNAYDSYLLIANALPAALSKAKPGTKEFRAALRDAIEATSNFAGTQGIYNITAENHVGIGLTSVVMATVKEGHWDVLDRN